MTISQWDHTLDATPGASSQATAPHAFTAERTYWVFVTQYRTDSVQPAVPTVTGMSGTSFENISPAGAEWDTSAPSMRSTHVFKGTAAGSGTGVLTVNYASAPDLIDIVVLEAVGYFSHVGVVQSATATINAGVFAEPITMPALADSANRIISYTAFNIGTGTARYELDADTGGDADWTTGTLQQSGSSPTGTFFAGWRDNATADLTVGIINQSASNATYFMVALELDASPVIANLPYVGMLCWGSSTPGPVEDPYRLLVGATVQVVAPITDDAVATSTFEADCGVPAGSMPIGRRFNSSTPTNFATVDAFSQDTNKRHRVISIKGETDSQPTQAQHETFMATIPNDGYLTWYMAHHEPDNDINQGNLTHTTTWFQGQLNRLHAAWVALGSPAHIIPSFCLTSWLDRDGNAGTTSADWFPSAGIMDDFTFWIDPYDPNGVNSMEAIISPSRAVWIAEGGNPAKFGVAETGTHRNDVNTVNWISTGLAYARSVEMTGVCWFNSSVGVEGPWYLTNDRDFGVRTLAPLEWGAQMVT